VVFFFLFCETSLQKNGGERILKKNKNAIAAGEAGKVKSSGPTGQKGGKRAGQKNRGPRVWGEPEPETKGKKNPLVSIRFGGKERDVFKQTGRNAAHQGGQQQPCPQRGRRREKVGKMLPKGRELR